MKSLKPNRCIIFFKGDMDKFAWEHLCDKIGAPYDSISIIIHFNDKHTDWVNGDN